ncbi:MAG: hypothetical protein EZS28_016467 [Streblomastix strix]|uniref:Uncharacterized protein n=1 Tax=Streblomastix strix TaxID=222440 RepID=A0A5J4W0J4_9EUKA|nr:MAG: hypothetical protein EZS28_016467 [Streblomastix strix]
MLPNNLTIQTFISDIQGFLNKQVSDKLQELTRQFYKGDLLAEQYLSEIEPYVNGEGTPIYEFIKSLMEYDNPSGTVTSEPPSNIIEQLSQQKLHLIAAIKQQLEDIQQEEQQNSLQEDNDENNNNGLEAQMMKDVERRTNTRKHSRQTRQMKIQQKKKKKRKNNLIDLDIDEEEEEYNESDSNDDEYIQSEDLKEDEIQSEDIKFDHQLEQIADYEEEDEILDENYKLDKNQIQKSSESDEIDNNMEIDGQITKKSSIKSKKKKKAKSIKNKKKQSKKLDLDENDEEFDIDMKQSISKKTKKEKKKQFKIEYDLAEEEQEEQGQEGQIQQENEFDSFLAGCIAQAEVNSGVGRAIVNDSNSYVQGIQQMKILNVNGIENMMRGILQNEGICMKASALPIIEAATKDMIREQLEQLEFATRRRRQRANFGETRIIARDLEYVMDAEPHKHYSHSALKIDFERPLTFAEAFPIPRK